MNNKKSFNVLFLVQAAMIAAIYVVLTFIANALGLANYAIQVRFSEALTVLPFFTGAAIPGLFIGCLLSNILTGCILPDIIFGSLTTLVAAVLSYLCRKIKFGWNKWLVPVPPIVLNMLVVPFVLAYAYQIEGSIPFFMLTVGAGELISCGVIGMILFFALQKNAARIFGYTK